MKRTISLVAVIFLFSTLDAQLKTYLTLEAGPHWSMYRVSDPGNYFTSANVPSSILGVTLGQELMKNLSVVTGLYYQPYKTGINMDDKRPQPSRLDDHLALMVPVRVQYRIQPTDFPVSFTPRLGYMYSRNSNPETPFVTGSILSAPDGTAFSYDLLQGSGKSSNHLLEVGAGLGLRIFGYWQASLNLSYLTGVFDAPSPSNILNYTDQQGNNYTAEYNSKGNGLFTTLSFHVPVSNIWQNKDYRIRARIENSVYEGKDVERKGQFYVGGEIGSLWRLFVTSNPALGARPMEGRVPLRYANLHAGGYVGYMLTHELGVDLGVNYQGSSTFYSLMYDHRVNFEGETPAPMYLEVPLRIRYFYDLYKEKIYAVVYGGASLLTHLSSGEYAAPGGDFTYTAPATQAPENATASATALRLSHLRPVMRIGAGVEYLLPMKFPMFITGYIHYMHGFRGTEVIDIATTFPGDTETSFLYYYGSGWSVDLGVKIPMSFDDRDHCVKISRKGSRKSGKTKS
jgi:hypothetical protein